MHRLRAVRRRMPGRSDLPAPGSARQMEGVDREGLPAFRADAAVTGPFARSPSRSTTRRMCAPRRCGIRLAACFVVGAPALSYGWSLPVYRAREGKTVE